jgi:hypothetical protein
MVSRIGDGVVLLADAGWMTAGSNAAGFEQPAIPYSAIATAHRPVQFLGLN